MCQESSQHWGDSKSDSFPLVSIYAADSKQKEHESMKNVYFHRKTLTSSQLQNTLIDGAISAYESPAGRGQEIKGRTGIQMVFGAEDLHKTLFIQRDVPNRDFTLNRFKVTPEHMSDF